MLDSRQWSLELYTYQRPWEGGKVGRTLPTVKWVKDAIRSFKNGKATGIDAIYADMLKVSNICCQESFPPFSMKYATLNEVWECEEIPEDWRNG